MKKFAFVLLGLLIVTLLMACAPAPTPAPTAAPPTKAPEATKPPATPAPAPAAGARLAAIKSRGKLICGVHEGLPGWAFLDKATGTYAGFDADFCRVMAAAVFGDPKAVEFRPLSAASRGPALQTGEIDVLIRNTTWTLSRDTSWGLFAPTTFYDGQGMMVPKKLGAKTLKDLKGASICVMSGTTTEQNLTDVMRAAGIDFKPVVFADLDSVAGAYEQGRCDAFTTDKSGLAGRRSIFKNPDDHEIMDVTLSKEPLGPVVPFGDVQWFNVVKWAVFATIEAEEAGITSKNVDQVAATTKDPAVRRLLGLEGDLHKGLGLEKDWVIKIIKGVGNYGEIYDRNLGPATPLSLPRGPNNLWTKGGLLYAPPFR
jgi:general L-amino acid transport system substrate-binding protein